MIIHFQEVGINVAFNCSELDLLLSEVEKVEKWKQHCMDTLGTLIGDENSLLGAFRKVWMKILQLSNLYLYLLFGQLQFVIVIMYR